MMAGLCTAYVYLLVTLDAQLLEVAKTMTMMILMARRCCEFNAVKRD